MGSIKKLLTYEISPRNPGGAPFPFSKRPKNQPSPYWQSLHRVRWTFFLAITSAYASALICWVGLLPGVPRRAAYACYFLGILLSNFWWLATRRALRRFVRKLQEHDLHLCMSCGYSLRGLPAQHACPECGTEYDLDQLQKDWAYWIAKRKLPPKDAES